MKQRYLWINTPGMCEEIPIITEYLPQNKKSNAAIVIFPGGSYCIRAERAGRECDEF